MKSIKLLSLVLLLLVSVMLSRAVFAQAASQGPRSTQSFDADWLFVKADPPGAEQASFNDSTWQKLNVPHDWSIAGPFSKDNPTGGAGAFLPAGIGWYRKHFTLPAADANRRIFIDFDGVMANSDVWINGYHLGERPNGYVSFRYEMTGHLHFGPHAVNVLAVEANNSLQPASRWYEGAGIYRNVRLVVTNPVHLVHWSTFITTPHVSASSAVVHVQSQVVNQGNTPIHAALHETLLAPDGRTVGTAETAPRSIPAQGTVRFTLEISLAKPDRWDIDHPALYQARTTVLENKTITDDKNTAFGIRACHFSAATGFWINGRNVKIKGICMHDDSGGLGTAVPLSAWKRRLTELKEIGVNAIRTSHNPVDPKLLNLCDQMGFLVLDEYFDCWTVGKNPYDYHLYFKKWALIDTRDMVRRDRNHPSIIMYSAGNEIHDTPDAPRAKSILASLLTVYHHEDPTRPVTMALFRPNSSHDYTDGLAAMLDVVGTNYRYTELLAAQAANPTWKIIGTENGKDLRSWLAVRDNPSYSGEFLWSGVDYLGEARHWPRVASGAGLIDLTGHRKPVGYQFQSWWSDKPMVYIARRVAPAAALPTDPGFAPLNERPGIVSNWTPRNLGPHEETVVVYSNCQQVELLLNGQSLGSKPLPADDSPRTWMVPFAAGDLHAIGRNNGQAVANDTLRSAGSPAKITLSLNKTRLSDNWNDVCYALARVTDSQGVRIPTADNRITFHISGPGVVSAVDNADLDSHEPFQASQRSAYMGRCLAILRSTAPKGKIILTAEAKGLAPASITLQAAPAPESLRKGH